MTFPSLAPHIGWTVTEDDLAPTTGVREPLRLTVEKRSESHGAAFVILTGGTS